MRCLKSSKSKHQDANWILFKQSQLCSWYPYSMVHVPFFPRWLFRADNKIHVVTFLIFHIHHIICLLLTSQYKSTCSMFKHNIFHCKLNISSSCNLDPFVRTRQLKFKTFYLFFSFAPGILPECYLNPYLKIWIFWSESSDRKTPSGPPETHRNPLITLLTQKGLGYNLCLKSPVSPLGKDSAEP